MVKFSLGGTVDWGYKERVYKTCDCGIVAYVPKEAVLDIGSFYNGLVYDTETCSGKCGRFWVWKNAV